MENSELKRRITTGLALASVFLLLDLLAFYSSFGAVLLAIIGMIVVGLCGSEFASFSAKNTTNQLLRFMVVLAPMPFLVLGVYLRDLGLISSAIVGGVAFGFLVQLLTMLLVGRSSVEKAGIVFAELAPAQALIGLGGLCMCSLVLLPHGSHYILWLVAMVCISDTAAYFGGRGFGGPKLAPAISPGKTVSGSISGMVAALAVGLIISTMCGYPGGFIESAFVIFIVVFAAQLGDLTKSYLKRVYQVKDSGSILPGHGGVLDRVDGILSGSVVFLAIILLGMI